MSDVPLNTKSIIGNLAAIPGQFAADETAAKGDLSAATAKIQALKDKQAGERAPLIQQIKDKNAAPQEAFNPQAMPEFKPPEMDVGELQNTMGLMVALSAMSGLLTRQPLTAALNAFNGGVQGVIQGNQEAYKRSQDVFKANFEKAKVESENYYKKVQDARQRRGADIQGLMTDLQLLSAEHQDQLGSALLAKQDTVEFSKMMEKRHELVQKVDTGIAGILQADQRAGESARHNRAMESVSQMRANATAGIAANQPQWTPEEIEHAAQNYRVQGSQALTGLPPRSPLRADIVKRAMQLSMAAGETGAAFGARRQEMQADSASLRKMAPMYDAVSAWGKMVDLNGKILKELAEKVDRDGVPVVERFTRALRRGTNPGEEGADVAEFFAQLQIFNTEAARALTNPNLTGVVTDTSRAEISDLLQRGASPAQINRVVDRLSTDTHNRLKTLEDQYKDIDSRMRSGGGLSSSGAAPQAASPRAMLNNRPIVVNGGKWVYEDTGQPAQ